MSPNTANVPATAATAANNPTDNTPSPAATGTTARLAACPSAHTPATNRRGNRSTHTPAGSPNTRYGNRAHAATTPIPHGPAPNVSAATNGTATTVTCDPTSDTDWPTHNNRNDRFRLSTAS
ncbi:hypothetical protein GCM10027184_09650 [Saccharothrix stipae]